MAATRVIRIVFASAVLMLPAIALAQVRNPRVFILDAKQLPPDLIKLERDAQKALTSGPFSVTTKTATPPSGDKHDYMSQAPYFWPNPATTNGLPYIRRDGEHNPEIDKITDHRALDQMESAVEVLAQAYYVTRKEEYAAKAASLLRTFFLAAPTRMNPNLQFAQAIPGVNTGRGIGLIETRGLTRVVDAIGLLAGSKSWTIADQKGMESWFAEFLQWMQESKNGRDESAAKNNHGTFYDVQVVSFALFLNRRELARSVLETAKTKRIALQIEPDGRQPLELERTKAWSYSVMNLDGLMLLARLGENVGVDLWRYETRDGRSIRKALDFLQPFAAGAAKWPYQQLGAWEPEVLLPLINRASRHYQDADPKQIKAPDAGGSLNPLLSDSRIWPYKIPARIHDGANKDVLVMTLGDVSTPLADGVFDPTKDELRLNDNTVIPHYFRDTLKIKYFHPIDKTQFPLPPSGWCSWYFFYQEIDENEIKLNAKWIADNLKDYGVQYVQIDDGWQGKGHGLGENRDWFAIDKRFAGGMDQLAAYIKSLGLKPGIWLAPHGQSSEAVVKNHSAAFLLKPDGTSAANTWEGIYLVDPSTPESRQYLQDLFTRLVGWGYEYFKIDGQPIVVREFRNKKSFMKAADKTNDTDELYRATLKSIREGIGPRRYLLGCWGVPLEGIGLMNGSRTGADVLPNWDGFKYAMRATMQYYFLHNVAWYTDPDVFIVRAPLPLEQARAWATLQGLTGQAALMSDRLLDLSSERVELIKRVYPAVDIRPLDLFSADRNKRIWDLKINHLGRQYDVVGLFNFDETNPDVSYVAWKDLGLQEERPVHVFDFWHKEYLGAWAKGISLELLPASTRVLSLVPATDQIQLISTSRHITQGWVDLVSQHFDRARNVYSGRSRVVRNDPYSLWFAFPPDKNFVIKRATAGGLPVRVTNHQGWAEVQITSPRTTEVSWEVVFEPATGYHFPVREPSNLRAESVGVEGVNLRWNIPAQPTFAYEVSLNGRVLGSTPDQAFALRRLDPNLDYTAEVRSVWRDGTKSEKAAKLQFKLRDVQPADVFLSELDPVRLTPGWRQPELNRRDVNMPTNSEIEFELNGTYDTFTASVGHEGNGKVEFAVIGDGKELWATDGHGSVKVDVRGVHHLTLRVRRVDEGGRIVARWREARLIKN